MVGQGRWGRAGFTAIELILGGAIMTTVTAISIPWTAATLEGYRLRTATWQVAGHVRLARQKAITAHRSHQVCFVRCGSRTLAPNAYHIERNDGTNAAPAWVRDLSEITELDSGIVVSARTSGGGTRLIFRTNGSASSYGTVQVRSGAGSYDVAVDSVGRIRVCKDAC